MADGARLLAVGRLRKPHGLRGECAVFPLTSEPDNRFARGRTLWLVNRSVHEYNAFELIPVL